MLGVGRRGQVRLDFDTRPHLVEPAQRQRLRSALRRVPVLDTVGAPYVEAKRLVDVEKRSVFCEAEPHVIITRDHVPAIEPPVQRVKLATPHRMRPGVTQVEQALAVVIGPMQSTDDARPIVRDVEVVRTPAVGIGECKLGVSVERARKAFESVRAVPVVGVGVRQILAARERNRTIPRHVDALALRRTHDGDVLVTLNELQRDIELAAGRRAVDHDNFKFAALEKSLRDEVLEATAEDAVGCVSRHDRRDTRRARDRRRCEGHTHRTRRPVQRHSIRERPRRVIDAEVRVPHRAELNASVRQLVALDTGANAPRGDELARQAEVGRVALAGNRAGDASLPHRGPRKGVDVRLHAQAIACA